MNEFVIRPLAEREIDMLIRLAREIWHAHYPDIISREQIDVMLEHRYSSSAVRESLHSQNWDAAWLKPAATPALLGFANSFADAEPGTWKLDKLYVHPAHQRKGIGLALLAETKKHALDSGARRLILRVNRRNAIALSAYSKYGFRIYGENVLDIGNGFVMDDYLLEMDLHA